MYCPHCMKNIPSTTTTCPFCAKATHTPVAGMATLRVSCSPHVHLWMMIVQPFSYFSHYNVYISVDDQEYLLKSNKKQIDIPVSVGTHQIRISSKSKKMVKAMKFAGMATAFVGSVLGSGSTIYAGAAMEDLGNAFSNDGAPITFNSNELKTVSVKHTWLGTLKEDDGL